MPRYPLVPRLSNANVGNAFIYDLSRSPLGSVTRGQVNFMSRTVDASGIDLAADAIDLLSTVTGDLDIITGVDVIIDNLLRLLTTAPGGYARYLRINNGVEIYNPNFHNAAYNSLSQPLNSGLSSSVLDAIREAALQETRIVLEDLVIEASEDSSLSFLNTMQGKLNIRLTYHVKGESELRTTRVQIPIIEKEPA